MREKASELEFQKPMCGARRPMWTLLFVDTAAETLERQRRRLVDSFGAVAVS